VEYGLRPAYGGRTRDEPPTYGRGGGGRSTRAQQGLRQAGVPVALSWSTGRLKPEYRSTGSSVKAVPIGAAAPRSAPAVGCGMATRRAPALLQLYAPRYVRGLARVCSQYPAPRLSPQLAFSPVPISYRCTSAARGATRATSRALASSLTRASKCEQALPAHSSRLVAQSALSCFEFATVR